MDKFGIFNLLSSLLGGKSAFGGNDFYDNSETFKPPVAKTTDNKLAEKRAMSAPLQQSMLLTMKNHDEFIKRVKDKQKTNR